MRPATAARRIHAVYAASTILPNCGRGTYEAISRKINRRAETPAMAPHPEPSLTMLESRCSASFGFLAQDTRQSQSPGCCATERPSNQPMFIVAADE